jgi:MFS family permease
MYFMSVIQLAQRAPLLPLFLVSLAAVAFEISLTRFFSIASWSEYGYWVISITMVGIAASGVVLSVAQDWFLKHQNAVFRYGPALMMLAAAGGYWLSTAIKFNPLELQNHATMGTQLLNIGAYYLALFPFFFLAGLFIGLYFSAWPKDIAPIYAADLIGAGLAGALAVWLMTLVHPFLLPLLMGPLLILAGWPIGTKASRLALIICAVLSSLVLLSNKPDYNQFKSIYAPLQTEGNKVKETIYSPRGLFTVLENFTERLDMDISNNEKVLAGAEPITTYGLYNDGNRLTSLPKQAPGKLAYLPAALDIFPYQIKPKADVLLLGTRGGYRIDEVRQLGASKITALEPEPTLFGLIQKYRPDLRSNENLSFELGAVSTYFSTNPQRKFDLIDVALDFQGAAEVSKYALTVDAFANYLDHLTPGGMVSVPVSIREYTVYALKTGLTIKEALKRKGINDPSKHLLVYRSAWNARFLFSAQPFDAAAVDALKAFASERSFDLSFFPGIDIDKLEIWNDLPQTSFDDGTVKTSEKADDALARDLVAHLVTNTGTISKSLNLTPATTDRPFLYNILRFSALDQVFKNIALVPREEIGYLVNVAVLTQSLILATLVLALPLFRRKTMAVHKSVVGKSILYFSGLGIGFLFLEIYLIEKATYLLNDRTLGFSFTLGSMLFFSGVGSYWSGQFDDRLKRGIRLACMVILGWCLLAFAFADVLLSSTLGLSTPAKLFVLTVWVAPLALALGFPFSLGLAALRPNPVFMPWAWSLNGAFSVISTPLANLLSIAYGQKLLVILGFMGYLTVMLMLPVAKEMAFGNKAK